MKIKPRPVVIPKKPIIVEQDEEVRAFLSSLETAALHFLCICCICIFAIALVASRDNFSSGTTQTQNSNSSSNSTPSL